MSSKPKRTWCLDPQPTNPHHISSRDQAYRLHDLGFRVWFNGRGASPAYITDSWTFGVFHEYRLYRHDADVPPSLIQAMLADATLVSAFEQGVAAEEAARDALQQAHQLETEREIIALPGSAVVLTEMARRAQSNGVSIGSDVCEAADAIVRLVGGGAEPLHGVKPLLDGVGEVGRELFDRLQKTGPLKANEALFAPFKAPDQERVHALELDVAQAAVLLGRCKQLLAGSNHVGEIRGVRDHAKAVAAFQATLRSTQESINTASEIAVRAECRLGELLRALPLDRGGGDTSTGAREAPVQTDAVSLKDLGISKKESARCQRLAALEPADFQARIDALKARAGRVSSTAILRETKDEEIVVVPSSRTRSPFDRAWTLFEGLSRAEQERFRDRVLEHTAIVPQAEEGA